LGEEQKVLNASFERFDVPPSAFVKNEQLVDLVDKYLGHLGIDQERFPASVWCLQIANYAINL